MNLGDHRCLINLTHALNEPFADPVDVGGGNAVATHGARDGADAAAPSERGTTGDREGGMNRNRPNDALCRRCDDSGVIADGPERWRPCTCAAGATVLEQLAATGRVAA